MQVSKEDVIEALKTQSIEEFADDMVKKVIAQYPSHNIDREATRKRFIDMSTPFAPKVETVKATDLARKMGIEVYEG